MSLRLLGISHRTATIEQREGLALSEAALPAALAILAAQPGVREALMLSTCNRTEIIVDTTDDGAGPDLMALLGRIAAGPVGPAERFYRLQGEQVARHAFRVAASLDSVVVGEPQILGQWKRAYAAAQDAGTIGPELEHLAARAFHAAKRVRTETGIAAHPVSASQAAVDLARQIFGDLSHMTVLLIGVGEMGETAARYLLQQGAARLLITNRTESRAQALAAKIGGEVLALERLPQFGELADVVISSTGSPQPLISRADAAHFLARRRGRPMLFLDLAVPRDIEPSVHQLDNAFVYNVDDLDQVISSNLAERQQEANQAEKIIEAEVKLFLQRRQVRELAPTLQALQTRAESLRQAEWERVRRRLGPLTPEQEQAVEALTRSLMQKWLHRPLVELKAELSATQGANRERLLDIVHRLFALTPAEEETEAGECGIETTASS